MSTTTVEIPKPLNTLSVQQEKFLRTQTIARVKGVRTLTGLNLMEAIAENAKQRQDASRGSVSLK